ncbi:MAG TPA: phage portal protein, partial [Chitinophagaceae bacterium]|nr:phage portal protein [Chitinophagaceae bacterium]
MNIFKAAWNALFEKKAAPVSNGRGAYYVNNGQVVWVADNFERYVVDGYSANDIVYSINFITSEKIKIAPWGAYTVEDESSLKSYRAELAKKEINVKAALHYRTKALKPFNGDGKLNELLKWPNEHETFSDLVAHSSVAKMMTGNRQVRGVLLDAGANAGKPQSLELLPPQFMIPVVSKTFPVNLIGWQLSCGQIIAISKEEVMHDKYYNPLYDMYGGHLIGMAPLRAASKTLTNANSALEASTKSFQNMGP